MTLSELLEEAREYCTDDGIVIPRHYIVTWRLVDTPTGPHFAAYIAAVKKEAKR